MLKRFAVQVTWKLHNLFDVKPITLAYTVQAVILIVSGCKVVRGCVPQAPGHQPHCLALLLTQSHLNNKLVSLVAKSFHLYTSIGTHVPSVRFTM